MRILFDNGTPNPIARCLTGHEVTYARRIGWHELKNGEPIQRAEEAGYEVRSCNTIRLGPGRDCLQLPALPVCRRPRFRLRQPAAL
jgi:hypothetical protein